MDYSPPGSSAHGIFQARILEWGAIAFSKHYMTVLKPVCFSKSHIYFPCASLESRISDFSYYLILQRVFPDSSVGKESACNAANLGSIPGLGRYPGEGNGNSLQYSCLVNSVDKGVWQATVHGITELDTTERLTLSFSYWVISQQTLTSLNCPSVFSHSLPTSYQALLNWFLLS